MQRRTQLLPYKLQMNSRFRKDPAAYVEVMYIAICCLIIMLSEFLCMRARARVCVCVARRRIQDCRTWRSWE